MKTIELTPNELTVLELDLMCCNAEDKTDLENAEKQDLYGRRRFMRETVIEIRQSILEKLK